MPKLSDLFDLNLMSQHLQDRVITCRVLDEANDPFGFRILNYTARAQYENIWDEVTCQCRGLIYDVRTLEVVARPFSKFFNAGDSRHPDTLPENFPPHQPFITRKYDGSLGILYKHNGKWRVATRGSFHSEQAEWATRWLQTKKDLSFPDGWTPIVEIVFAANKIVVDYDWEGLVLIGMVNIETGAEIAPAGLKFIAESNGLRPMEYFDRPVSGLLEENQANEEGYVLSWHVGDGAPLRVKVKFEDYCRLHRLVHQTSAVTIWEILKDGRDVEEMVVNAPDAMREWITRTRAEIHAEWHAIYHHAYYSFNEAPKGVSRKEFAEYAKKQHHLTPLLFALLDGKRIGDMVWKMVRPTSAEPFKQEEA